MLRQSITGNIYYLDNLGKILRIDYNPNQPRDARGRWSSSGGGGSGESIIVKGLQKKKVSELQGIAKDKGIDIDSLSHKNRKSILSKAIEAKLLGENLREKGLLKPTKTVLNPKKKSVISKRESGYTYHPSVEKILTNGERFTKKYQLNATDLKVHETLFKDIKATNFSKNNQGLPLNKRVEFLLSGTQIEGKIPTRKRKKIIQDITDFHELTNGTAKTVRSVKSESDRAHATFASVDVGKTANKTEIFHEFAHHLEFSDPKVMELAAQWRNSRQLSPDLQSLNQITSTKNYADDEIAILDKFIHPYVGKVYPNGYTEVISTGLEHFSSPSKMALLYEKDPDHYNFIVGILLK